MPSQFVRSGSLSFLPPSIPVQGEGVIQAGGVYWYTWVGIGYYSVDWI